MDLAQSFSVNTVCKVNWYRGFDPSINMNKIHLSVSLDLSLSLSIYLSILFFLALFYFIHISQVEQLVKEEVTLMSRLQHPNTVRMYGAIQVCRRYLNVYSQPIQPAFEKRGCI